MTEFISSWYLWIKALHLVAVVSWMAGLLYLPRIFVYHAGIQAGSETSETLKTMAHKLFRYIMNPAMIAVWVLGILLLVGYPEAMREGWFHAKATLVILLTGFHHVLGRWRKDFAADNNKKPAKFYRIANEIPTVLMVLIVIFVIVKPF